MEKGKDRASKLFFSDPDRAKDLVSLVLRMRGIKAELTGLAMEDPAVSFLDTRISMERLLDKIVFDRVKIPRMIVRNSIV